MSSDCGALLLRSANRALNFSDRLAACFSDYRDPRRIEHSLDRLLMQRVFGICLGYEDINDHNRLRSDCLLAVALEQDDVYGQRRKRARDRGCPLAGSSTLNRLELGTPQLAQTHRYKKITADPEALDKLLLDCFLDIREALLGQDAEPGQPVPSPEQLVLDIDATDDPLYGHQEGRFYNGYYRDYCYMPLYVTCGQDVLCARLRPSNVDPAAGALEELERIVGRIRERWPTTRLLVRGDAGFCRDRIMAWCEQNGVGYVLGLPKNPRLLRRIRKPLQRAKWQCRQTGERARKFKAFRYRTRSSWTRKRRVVAKAEALPGGRMRANPRFVVTNISGAEQPAQQLYEQTYCARGDMENRIKEQQQHLFADRTSTREMRSNQLRLYFSTFAYVLMRIIRGFGLEGTKLAKATSGTIRHTLLKVAGVVRVTVRKVWVAMCSTYVWRDLFATAAARLTALEEGGPVQAEARASPAS